MSDSSSPGATRTLAVKDDFAFRPGPAEPAEMTARAGRTCLMVGWPNTCFVRDTPRLECALQCHEHNARPTAGPAVSATPALDALYRRLAAALPAELRSEAKDPE